jgi:hypothetical protein
MTSTTSTTSSNTLTVFNPLGLALGSAVSMLQSGAGGN